MSTDPPADEPPDPLSPAVLVRAYASGYFPMADGRTGEVHWYSPDPRALLPFVEGDPLGAFRVRRSLAKRVRHGGYDVRFNTSFDDVIHACAQPRPGEPDTWISPAIESSFCRLHTLGVAHSVEAWHDGELVGGLYGVALGGAFFGESMFSRMPDASQVCLVHLVDYLRSRGYALLDVQFVNPHLEQFGVVEVSRDRYLALLAEAVARPVVWGD